MIFIYNNDDNKCQPNCKLSKYSEESEYLNCSCTINEEVNNMNEKFNSKKVFETFFNVLKYSNYKVIKCYNLVFTKFLITKNIGGIIVLVFIFIYSGCFIIFIIKGINPLKDKLKLKIGNKSGVGNKLDNNIDNILNDKIDIYKNSNKFLNIFYPPRRKSLNQNYKINKIINEINDDEIKESLVKTVKKNKKKKKAKKDIV